MNDLRIFAPINASGAFGHTQIRYDNYRLTAQTSKTSAADQPSRATLRKVSRLQDALRALRATRRPAAASQPRGTSRTIAGELGAVTSEQITFTPLASRMESTAEVNTAPTSFTPFGPDFSGSTSPTTAHWVGGSTSEISLGGDYNGRPFGQLTVRVTQAGTVGADDVQLTVFDASGTQAGELNISAVDPEGTTYSLDNGITLTPAAGQLEAGDEFQIDTTQIASSFTPTHPAWGGSTAQPTLSGTYLGASGNLTFEVTQGGVRGVDQLQIEVSDPNGLPVSTITIQPGDSVDTQYALPNGLSLQLGAGAVIAGQAFTVAVDTFDGNNYDSSPEWILESTAIPELGGTYNGVWGNDSITFRAEGDKTRGVDDIRIQVFDSSGSHLEDIEIKKEDPINQVYTLSSGLTLTLGDGAVANHEHFTIDVESETEFSATPQDARSTAEVTLGGVYDGSQGTGQIVFQIASGGIRGTDDISVNVLHTNGSLQETISISAADPLDQKYTLSTGLTFQSSAGSLVTGESIMVEVNNSVGSRVDHNQAFNGVRNNDPNFDSGLAVGAGTFTVNATTISVAADDTINSVLDRISSSAAGVQAEFDTVNERIVLTSPSGETVTVGNDTSGFLAATKLSDAQASAGNDGTTRAIAETNGLEAISSGSLRINDTDVVININDDSIQDIADRINAELDDVHATLDTETGFLSIASTDYDSHLTLNGNGTAFFETLGIADGTYESRPKSVIEKNSGMAMSRRRNVAVNLRKVSLALNELFAAPDFMNTVDSTLLAIRGEFRKAVAERFDQEDSLEISTGFGFEFNFKDTDKPALEFEEADRQRFFSRLARPNTSRQFNALMYGDSHNDGLVDELLDIATTARTNLVHQLGSIGTYIDDLM